MSEHKFRALIDDTEVDFRFAIMEWILHEASLEDMENINELLDQEIRLGKGQK